MNPLLAVKNDFHVLENFFHVLLICAPRCILAFAFIPVFSTRIISGFIRNVLVFAFILIPAVVNYEQIIVLKSQTAFLALVIFKECIIGIVLGVLLGLPFWVFETLGNLIENFRGTTFASMYNPMVGQDDLVLGHFFSLSAGVFLLSIGFMTFCTELITSTYLYFPVWEIWPLSRLAGIELFLPLMGKTILIALLLGAPIFLMILVIDFIFALLSVYVPSLQVYNFVGGVKSLMALAALVIYASFMFDYAAGWFKSDWSHTLPFLKQIFSTR
jgi:type III secretion protein T